MTINGNVWLTGASLLAALAVGFALGRGTNKDSSGLVSIGDLDGATSTNSQADDATSELLAELRGLRSDLRSFLEASQNREPAVTGSMTAQAELLGALKDVAQALREQPAKSREAVPALGVPRPTTARGFSDLNNLLEAEWHDALQAHQFWTLQDLVARYGVPDNFQVHEGTLRVYYLNPDRNKTERVFVLYDGQVIRVE